MSKRILIIFLAWSLFYLLPYNISAIYYYGASGSFMVAYANITRLIQDPLALVMQGTKVHLWFMVALLFACCISAIFIHKKWVKSLVVLSVLLYTVGVLAKAYAGTPLGLEIDFNTRNGPFFSTLLFVTGYLLSGFKRDTRWLAFGLLLFVAGAVIHLSEIYVIWKIFGTTPVQDFVFGTYIMGVGVAVASLSDHPVLQSSVLSKVGQMTLGIYAVHYLYVELFVGIGRSIKSPIWDICYILLVFSLSAVSVLILSRNRFARKGVM